LLTGVGGRAVYLQELVAKLGKTFIEFPPPLQEGASFGIDQVKRQIKEAIENHPGN
jgi:arylsulfatase